ncbi:MAG TPA: hypothetical protein VMU33_17290 [Burkholderiaceae bacterium]|nr:hypothetical protein [Burkholderiaceae bacterium]
MDVFSKLNLGDQREILVIDAPASFEPQLAALGDVRVARRLADVRTVAFALVFATKKAEVDRLSPALARKAVGDATLWWAYPKGTSKRLTCDFNRDNGWDALRSAGWDTVRQVAIDEDWSALRFRRVECIPSRASSATRREGGS